MVVLKQDGTATCARDRLNMSVSMPAGSDKQTMSARPGVLSGPAVFHGFILFRVLQTSIDVTVSNEFCEFCVLPMAKTSLCLSGLRVSNRA